VDQEMPGISLSSIYEMQPLQVDKLPTYSRERVEGNIQADDLDDARSIVGELQRTADECAARPAPKPTTPRPTLPKPTTPKPTAPKPPARTTPVARPSTQASTPPVVAATSPSSSVSPPANPDPADCDGIR
jgi:hypothetical protein